MLTAQGDERLVPISAGNTNFLFINTVSENNNGALKDLRVRQALNYAVDKSAIVQQWGGPTMAEPVEATPEQMFTGRSQEANLHAVYTVLKYLMRVKLFYVEAIIMLMLLL